MGYVYLIQNGDLFKIGRTDNLQPQAGAAAARAAPQEAVQALGTHLAEGWGVGQVRRVETTIGS